MPGSTLNILCDEKKTRKNPATMRAAEPMVLSIERPCEYVFLTITMR